MLKKTLGVAIIAAVFSVNSAAEVKTSSLTVAKPALSNNALPTECEQMFNTADKLVSEAEKQPGTHTQVAKMKNKLSSTKREILKMDPALQQKSCEKGLTALNTLREKHQ